jgi:hypothetical protein
MLSLGTGTSSAAKHKIGPHSPVKDRFVKRLLGNCMVQLDSEKQWKTFIQFIPPKLRNRYHRLNICFPGPEPAIDEVQAIQRLKGQAQQFIANDAKALLVRDTMIASIFYFELDSFSLKGNDIQCSGTIMCRLPLDSNGRLRLQSKLSESAAAFLVSGNPFLCLDTMPHKSIPVFRRRLDFTVKSITEDVDISIRGITSSPTPISGLPRPLYQLIEAGGLDAPFGCSDHREVDRPLPDAPLKRKFHVI